MDAHFPKESNGCPLGCTCGRDSRNRQVGIGWRLIPLAWWRKFIQTPAPRAIDVLETPDASYLLMTQVPGRPIGQLFNTMKGKQVKNAVTGLKRHSAELRAIPNEASMFSNLQT
ncbi:uncharacterized protein N7529_008019 [Penicillium soppii]|jgi:aminoglycoside phosphotransferase|uniref:uncharacterized protein n=1 Tax=Penicillium soppii TaxID=69789 RepID=UPI002547CD27|nr:uncharacterized protein N7529_008019 [Penicillium soppii]KAJ5860709.1 hypothetical protein N7529_008019 [Penicillium soppii]